jgi:hypothetical protein
MLVVQFRHDLTLQSGIGRAELQFLDRSIMLEIDVGQRVQQVLHHRLDVRRVHRGSFRQARQ